MGEGKFIFEKWLSNQYVREGLVVNHMHPYNQLEILKTCPFFKDKQVHFFDEIYKIIENDMIIRRFQCSFFSKGLQGFSNITWYVLPT